MAHSAEELLAHYRESRALLLAALENLTTEQMEDTSIDGWSVKDNLAHLAFWDDLRADEVTRISAGYESALKMDAEQDGQLNELAYQFRRSLSVEQALWELHRSRGRLMQAIETAKPHALNPDLYGEAGLVSGHESEHASYIRAWRDTHGI